MIAIITDSDSSLPHELAKKFNIKQVPITIQFGEETFETGIDIDDKILFEKIDALKKLPTTAAPVASSSALPKPFFAWVESAAAPWVAKKKTFSLPFFEETLGCRIRFSSLQPDTKAMLS